MVVSPSTPHWVDHKRQPPLLNTRGSLQWEVKTWQLRRVVHWLYIELMYNHHRLCSHLVFTYTFLGPGARACACSTLRDAGARQEVHRPVRAAGAPGPRGAPLPACVSAPDPVPGCHRPQPERFGASRLANASAPFRGTAYRRGAAPAWRAASGFLRARTACAARASAGRALATAARPL